MADIIDVQMFTTQLQKELADNITPELKKVTDISKNLNKAIIEGNIDVAVETIGSDKVKEVNRDLNASNAYFEKTIESANYIAEQFAGIEDRTIAINKVQGLTEQTNQRIANAQEKIKKQEEEIIPTIQSKVHQAELQLSLMKTTDDGYKQQQDRVKSLQDTLVRANASTADMIGQEQGLLHLRDNQLKILEQQLGTGRVVTSVIKDHVANGQKIISNSKKQLDLNADIQKTLDGMNDAQKKLLEDNKDLILETIGGFDSIKDSIMGAFDKLPLVGGILKSQIKGPLEEAAKTAKTAFVQSFIAAKEAAHNTGSSVAGIGAGMKEFAKGIGGMGKAVIGALLNPFSLVLIVVGGLLLLLKSAFDELSRLENASKDFRLELGLSASESSRLRAEAEQLEDTYSMLGLRVDDFYRANAALLEVFTSTGHVTKSQTETIALMEKAYGVQASTTAGAMNNLMKLGATGRGEAEGMVMEMKQLAGKHGVQFAKVMEDVANAGEDAMLFARGSAKALASGAVHARRMGSSIEDVASAASKLLDFEGSINAEMEASTMFGRHINMSTLRRAAMLGNEKMMLQERHRIMDSLGGLENMNRFRQEQLAEAMGTTVGELQNMVKVREQENLLIQARNRGEKWATDEFAEREKMAKQSKKTVEEQLKAEILKNREMEKVNAMTDTLAGYWLKVKKALLPIVNGLMKDLVTFMNQFVSETGSAGDKTSKLEEMVSKVKDVAMNVWEVVKGIGSAIMWVVENWEIALGVLIAYKATMMTLSALTTAIATAAASGGGGGGGKGGGIFGSIAKAINSIKPTTMLAAAASILVLSGALFVTAKAFQEFAKVNWKNAWPGFIAMGALVLMAKSLSSASVSMLIGAAAIAALGVALIPATYAFQMFSEVSWKDVIFGGIAIGVLAAAAFGLGLILGPIALGAAAIALLGASLIPLAFALKLAAPALESFGKIFLGFASIMVKALDAIIGGIIEFAEIVGGTIVKVFKTLGGIIESAGNAIVGVVTAIGQAISGIITSYANGIATVIGSVSGAITAMVDDITRLSEIDAVNLIAVAGGIGAVGVALASFGVGGGVGAAASGVGNAVGALGNSIAGVFGADTDELNKSPLQKILDFAKESESIILVSDKIDSLLNSFDRLAGMESILETAASALQKFGVALASFGAGNTAVGMGNAIGAIGNKVAGMFGADVPQDPIDQLMGFIDKLGSVDLNVESLQILSELNLGGFLGGITDEFEDKIEIASDGLNELFNAFGKVKPASVGSLERTGTGISRLFESLAQSLPRVKVSDTKNLGKIAESLEDFFEAIQEINISKVASLPTVALGIKELSVGMADVSNIPLESGEILDAVGTGIDDLFYELADSDLSMMKALPAITASIKPFISEIAILPISKIPKNVDYLLSELGTGVHDFFDNLAGMNPEALKYNTHFEQIVGNMVNLAGMPEVDFTSKFTSLTNIADKLNPENVDKLKAFTEGVASAIDKFANIQDPAVQALTAISRELYMLCDVIEKLDLDKLNKLENINIGGVQTEIKIPPRDPFLEGTVTEGILPPKLMMTESPSLADAFAVESKPKVIEETMTKRAKEREDTFRQQYETADEITKRIESDLKFLEEEKAKYANDEVGMRSIQGGIKLVMEDVAVLEKLRSELKSEQPVVDAITPTTNTQESSLQNFFAEPPTETQVQQVTDTGTTSLADVFASPPPEMVTEQKPEISILKNEKIKDAKKINEMVQPIVDVVGSIYTKFIPESIKQKFSDFAKNEYFNLDEDHSMEAYKRSLGVNESVTNDILGDMGVMSAEDISSLNTSGDKVNENQFTSSTQFEKVAQSTGLLDQIMAGILRKELPTKLYAEGQLVGLNTNSNIRMYEDQDGFTQVDESMKVSVNDISPQLAKNVGSRIKMLDEAIINGTTLENDSLNKLLESRRQQLTDEGRLVVNEIQSQVGPQINPEVDVLDSTSTKPIVQRLQIAENQPQFKLDVIEPINEQIQESEINPASSIFTKISDFAKNILPDFDFFDSQTDADESSFANIELSGLDNISVKGHNIFVEEIAKIVNKDTPTSDSEKTEDNTKVVKKLDELILLMRRGGIQVNVDGRKVSKAVATAQDQ